MEIEIVNIISSLGFPIACVLGLGYYVNKLTENYRSDLANLEEESRKQTQIFREALLENTVAIKQMCTLLTGEVNENEEGN